MRMGTADLEQVHSSGGIERRVKDIFVHTKYKSGKVYNDVGIAEADTLIEFNRYVRPVCLPYLPIDNDNFLAGEFVTTAGFGYTVQARSGQTDLTSNLKLKSLKVSPICI